VLLHPPPLPRELQQHYSWVDNTFILGTHKGHRPILVDTPCLALLHRQRSHSAISPPPLRAVRAAVLSESVETSFHPCVAAWCDALNNLDTGTAIITTHAVLTDVVEQIVAKFHEATYKANCLPHPGQKRPFRILPAAYQAKARKRHLSRLVNALNITLAAGTRTCFSHAAAKARHDLLNITGGSAALGDCAFAQWHHLDRWRAFVARSQALINQTKAAELEARKSQPSHPLNRKDKMFRSATGRGQFYREWIGGDGSAGSSDVSYAIDGEGVVHTDPTVYLPMVRDTVRRSISNPKPGPAVGTWRPLNDKEKATLTILVGVALRSERQVPQA
jgi:hypothetical protein